MPTMQEIADELGLSRVAVSSVLNGKARERGISEATAERVRRHLEQIGFVPSSHARNLRGAEAGSIGVVYCGFLYSHLGRAYNHLVHALASRGLDIETHVVPGHALEAAVHHMAARRVRRLVWFLTDLSGPEVAEVRRLLPVLRGFERCIIYNVEMSAPLAIELARAGIHTVGVDRPEGYLALGRRLKALGHRRVCCPEYPAATMERSEEPTWRALERAGLTVCGACPDSARYAHTPEFAAQLVGGILHAMQADGVTAACFGDDEIAGYAMTRLLARGVRIPEDLSVTGYDGMPFAEALCVPLATLRLPVEDMVGRALSLLTGRGSPKRKRHRFALELVERRSLGKSAGR